MEDLGFKTSLKPYLVKYHIYIKPEFYDVEFFSENR